MSNLVAMTGNIHDRHLCISLIFSVNTFKEALVPWELTRLELDRADGRVSHPVIEFEYIWERTSFKQPRRATTSLQFLLCACLSKGFIGRPGEWPKNSKSEFMSRTVMNGIVLIRVQESGKYAMTSLLAWIIGRSTLSLQTKKAVLKENLCNQNWPGW
jgi:hypothetical protein